MCCFRGLAALSRQPRRRHKAVEPDRHLPSRPYNCAFAHSRMQLLPVPTPGQIERVRGLLGSSDALALARLATQRHPLAVLTGHALDGQRLSEEVAFFAPAL